MENPRPAFLTKSRSVWCFPPLLPDPGNNVLLLISCQSQLGGKQKHWEKPPPLSSVSSEVQKCHKRVINVCSIQQPRSLSLPVLLHQLVPGGFYTAACSGCSPVLVTRTREPIDFEMLTLTANVAGRSSVRRMSQGVRLENLSAPAAFKRHTNICHASLC